MTKVSEKYWNSVMPTFRSAAREGRLNPENLENNIPTHIIDIYKMRRGRYKNVRIWIKLDLGTGYREDLFMTTADNQPIRDNYDIFLSSSTVTLNGWENEISA